MTFHDLLFDQTGPYGFSREAWWAVITTVLIGGMVPVVWRQLWKAFEKRRWEPLRRHLGVMLAWDHEHVGKTLRSFNLKGKVADEPFIKIQDEIGRWSAVVVSDSALAKCVGDYMCSANELWWWLDGRPDSTGIPTASERKKYSDLLKCMNDKYERVMYQLRVGGEYRGKWVLGDNGEIAVEGMGAVTPLESVRG